MLSSTLAVQDAVAKTVAAAAENVPQSGGAAHLILLLTVFVLAIFLGVEIITKIPPTLHTPLMSGSNAISGITLVGAVLATGADNGTWASILGFAAVVFATMNVVGGFVVTNRMLAMFRTKK
ncbi:MAG: NAD(P) transhydrogenase subunit alpha [Fuerstiella sp.]|jgi:H+-translocating NAD(P) transhydrogenase subunit alpha|nr:NAD(P) transhydrogenase subunit alpha [Fuerstiella sp.]